MGVQEAIDHSILIRTVQFLTHEYLENLNFVSFSFYFMRASYLIFNLKIIEIVTIMKTIIFFISINATFCVFQNSFQHPLVFSLFFLIKQASKNYDKQFFFY